MDFNQIEHYKPYPYCNMDHISGYADKYPCVQINLNDCVKRRGPKKKPVTQERVVKLRQRRARANARERSRMHGLNHALDTLRSHIPMAIINKLPEYNSSISCLPESAMQNALNSSALLGQRLSKIETLRLARNYISLLADLLAQPNSPLNKEKLLFRLSNGLSQITSNQIAVLLGLNPLPSNKLFEQQNQQPNGLLDQTQLHQNAQQYLDKHINPVYTNTNKLSMEAIGYGSLADYSNYYNQNNAHITENYSISCDEDNLLYFADVQMDSGYVYSTNQCLVPSCSHSLANNTTVMNVDQFVNSGAPSTQQVKHVPTYFGPCMEPTLALESNNYHTNVGAYIENY